MLVTLLVTAAVAIGLGLSPIGATRASATGNYDYFCKNSYGTTTPWNGRNQLACDGFLYSYRDGTYMGRINIPNFRAQNSTPITYPNLDRWCSAHSFWCTVVVSGFFYSLSFGRSA